MTFRLRLKRISKPNHTRFNALDTFQAMIGGTFAPLTIKNSKDIDIDTMITTFNKAVTETDSDILGKHCQKKKPWVNAEILDLYDKRKKN